VLLLAKPAQTHGGPLFKHSNYLDYYLVMLQTGALICQSQLHEPYREEVAKFKVFKNLTFHEWVRSRGNPSHCSLKLPGFPGVWHEEFPGNKVRSRVSRLLIGTVTFWSFSYCWLELRGYHGVGGLGNTPSKPRLQIRLPALYIEQR
jgi:hypothetical protein